MNDLQKVEFDLFKEFVRVCEELNLKYFLVCGSVLGAARHKGFIPWDDDFDVGMYRDDYNKFIEQAPKLLPEGLFLQNYKSDPQFPYMFSKLRNSKTTFIQSILSKLKMNHGIYIDIFPLDGYPKSAKEQKKLEKIKRKCSRRTVCALNMPSDISFKGKVSVFLFRLLGCHKRTAKTLAEYEKFISKYPIKDSDLICNHGTWHGKRDYIKSEWYGNGTQLMFEGVKVTVPENFDKYLTSLYGDWRKFPPVEKQKGIHNCDFIDTKKPYTFYLNDESIN